MSAPTGGRHRRAWRLFSVHFATSLLLWPAFTGSARPHELLVGVGVLALTLLFMRDLQHCMPVHVRFRFSDIVQVWRLPGETLHDAAMLTWALLRSLAGGTVPASRYRLLRWSTGPTPAEVRGREVLLATYLSATPNSIVLGVDRGESLAVMHELVPGPLPGMAHALGARP